MDLYVQLLTLAFKVLLLMLSLIVSVGFLILLSVGL